MKADEGRAVAMDEDDGWAVSRPEDDGVDVALLRGLRREFESWPEANLHAALIVRNGKLVYEQYFSGKDEAWGTPLGDVTYEASLRHDLRSITKSITSLLFGIAIDRGWIDDVDQSVFSFFPEHGDLRTPEKDRITIRHLLAMAAGLVWSEQLPYSNPANSERRMTDAASQDRYVLEQPVARPAGTVYNYNGGLTVLLASILQRASCRPIDVFAKEELFDPLGVRDVEWMRYANGSPNAASGLRMRPRDLAKVGQLVLSKGIWNGRRIVSERWIEESTSPHINGEGLYFYGYQWWLGRSLVNCQEVQWISAVGYGGQRMYVVPRLGLVVVVMAGLYDNPILQSVVGEVVLGRYALPAVMRK